MRLQNCMVLPERKKHDAQPEGQIMTTSATGELYYDPWHAKPQPHRR
jgi:hypothetical protein